MTLRIATAFVVLGLTACSEEVAPPATTPAEITAPAAETTPAPATDTHAYAAPAPAIETATTPVTYEIALEAAKASLPTSCTESVAVYNDCSGAPIELSWQDTGTAAPKSVRLELGVSLFCADPLVDSSYPQRQGVSVNGKTVGGFDGDLAACTCAAPMVTHGFDLTTEALADYQAGGVNQIKVAGPNRCIGLSPLLAGGNAVARIVVTY